MKLNTASKTATALLTAGLLLAGAAAGANAATPESTSVVYTDPVDGDSIYSSVAADEMMIALTFDDLKPGTEYRYNVKGYTQLRETGTSSWTTGHKVNRERIGDSAVSGFIAEGTSHTVDLTVSIPARDRGLWELAGQSLQESYAGTLYEMNERGQSTKVMDFDGRTNDKFTFVTSGAKHTVGKWNGVIGSSVNASITPQYWSAGEEHTINVTIGRNTVTQTYTPDREGVLDAIDVAVPINNPSGIYRGKITVEDSDGNLVYSTTRYISAN